MRQNILVSALVLGALCFVIGFVSGAILTKPNREKTNATIADVEAKMKGIQTNAQKQIEATKEEANHFQSELNRVTEELKQTKIELARFKEENRIAAEQNRVQEQENQQKQAKLEKEKQLAAEQNHIQEQERQQSQTKLKADLDSFMSALKVAGIDNTIINNCSAKGDKLTIVVANAWHLQSYQLRLQAAQNLWSMWAKIRSPNDLDNARIELTDYNGNSVGGSRWLAGSLIWVQEK
jgi:flagellar biosynthesis GTPase FlhF